MLGLQSSRFVRYALAATLTVSAWAAGTRSAKAQITPDTTLGAESSVVTPNVEVRGAIADQINGGAARGANLFHSFQDFNVLTNQRVYFSNPANIENIINRVTGSNLSSIDGLLGVDGAANLFLLNPNGIVFGSNAQLDVSGSFVSGTGTGFTFLDGSEFSATNPNAAPLVTVNVTPGIQFGSDAPATLTSQANLAAGQDLRLAAGSVTSSGSLTAGGEVSVEGVSGDVQVQDVTADSALLSARGDLILEENQLQTAGNLTLQAEGTVRIRDSAQTAFSADAGGNLTIRGVEAIDILALNHPGMPFRSGEDMTLISDGVVSGDARFDSGGNFSLLDTAGAPGEFISLYDPVIRANGDVTFGNYEGVSLLVAATGDISGGNITITGSECDSSGGGCPAGTGITQSDIPGATAAADFTTLTTTAAVILRAGQGSVGTANVAPPPPAGGTTVTTGGTTFAAATAGSDPGDITVNNISAGSGGTTGHVELTAGTNRTITLNGDVEANNSGSVSFNGRVSVNSSLEVSGGPVEFANALAIANNDLTITASEADFGGNVSGTGSLTIRPNAVGQAITLGGNTSDAALNLTAAEIGRFQASLADITIGRAGGTGTVDLSELADDAFASSVAIAGGGTLIGPNNNTTWNITGTEAGNLNDDFTNDLTFENISAIAAGTATNTVVGTDNNDNFVISGTNAGSFSGISFTGVDEFDGANGNDTITGSDNADTFTTTGTDLATVAGIDVSNVEILSGADGNDIFDLTAGSWSGTIDGDDGNDDFTVAIEVSTLNGNGGSDNFTLNNGADVTTLNAGGGPTDTVTINTGAEVATLNGQGGQDVVNLSGGTAGDINGGGGDDTFNLSAGTLNGTVSGGNQNDIFNVSIAAGTLSGDDDNDTFNLNNGANVTLLNAGNDDDVINLNLGSTAATINGEAGNDAFTAAGGTATTVNGGDDADTFNLFLNGIANANGQSGNDTFNLTNTLVTTAIDGGNSGSDNDTVRGSLNNDIFTITGGDSGTFGLTSFSEIENLEGSSGNDTFNLTGNSFDGTIDGGLDIPFTTGDVVNYGAGDDTVTLGADGLVNIETIDGGGGANTLQGTQNADTFTVNGINSGSVSGSENTLFTNFQSIAGRNGNDIFNIELGSQINSLAGEGGADDFNFNGGIVLGTTDGGNNNDDFFLNSGNAGTLVGDAGNDDFFLIGLTATADSIDGGGGGTDRIFGRDLGAPLGNDLFTITAANQGSVNGINFTEIEALEGRGGNDTFFFNDGAPTNTIAITGNPADLDLISFANFTTDPNPDLSILNGTGISRIQGSLQPGVASTLTGRNTSNTWVVDGTNTGVLNSTTRFLNFTNLVGGSNIDDFDVNFAGRITSIDAGGGSDSVDINFGGQVTTVVGNNGNDTINLNFGGQAATLAGDGGQDTIIIAPGFGTAIASVAGGDADDTITLFSGVIGTVTGGSGADEITVNGAIITSTVDSGEGNDTLTLISGSADTVAAGDGNDTFQLTGGNFNTLNGGAGNDSFNFTTDTFTSQIDGGDGNDDTLDFSAIAAPSITVDLNTLTAQSIERIIGNGADSNLIGFANTDNIWSITDTNSGTLNGAIAFENFQIYTGGTLSDTFIWSGSGEITGSINGQSGTLTLESDDAIAFTGTSITGTDSLIIQQSTADTGIGFDGVGSGLNLDSTLFNFGSVLANTFTDITIGNAETGDVVTNITSLTFNAPVTIQGRSVTSNSFISNSGNDVTLTGLSGAVILNSGINTATSGSDGGNISIVGEAVTLDDGVTIDPFTGFNPASTGKTGNISITALTGDVTLGSGILYGDNYNLGGGGDISIISNQGSINLNDGRLLISTNGGQGIGGSVSLQAAQAVNIQGAGAAIDTSTNGTGTGGSIAIAGGTINIQDQASLRAETTGSAAGGNIALAAAQSIDIQGVGTEVSTNASGSGLGGTITAQAANINLQNGANVSAQASAASEGGNVIFQAGQNLTLQDSNTEISTRTDGTGSGGDVSLTAGNQLTVDGSNITADASNSGAGGTISLQGGTVNLQNDATIQARTSSSGAAGNVVAAAIGELAIDDSSIITDTSSSGAGGNVTAQGSVVNLDNAIISTGTSGAGTGPGGDIGINAGTAFNLTDSTISASTLSSQLAIAGDISVTAPTIDLNNGRIIAETSDNNTQGGFITSSGLIGFNVAGGNITISGNGLGILGMTNNSLISARGIEVGATAAGTGPSNPAVAGGNIFLSNFLAIEATIPPSGPAGNDIVTNESLAGGGVIDFALILPTGFVRDNLGLSFAELRSNSQNDLSTNGLIDILDTGIFEEAAAIPLAFVDVSDLVGDSCSAGTSEGSEFTVGGQGGLPANPTQPLSPALDNNDWILLDELDNTSANPSQNSQLARQPQQPKGVCLNSLLSQTIQQ